MQTVTKIEIKNLTIGVRILYLDFKAQIWVLCYLVPVYFFLFYLLSSPTPAHTPFCIPALRNFMKVPRWYILLAHPLPLILILYSTPSHRHTHFTYHSLPCQVPSYPLSLSLNVTSESPSLTRLPPPSQFWPFPTILSQCLLPEHIPQFVIIHVSCHYLANVCLPY